MSGRYTYIPTVEETAAYLEATGETLVPNYNVAPMLIMPVVTLEGVKPMKWGMVPSAAKEFKPSFTSINARAETLAEKPMYKVPLESRRCLVPATSYYEWQQRAHFKQPYMFKLVDRDNFHFAGLYDVWLDADSKPHLSFTIITTEAAPSIREIHERMPVILDESEEATWLSNKTNLETLQALLNPIEDEKITHFEVSRDIGNVKNNSEALMQPVVSK